MKVRINIFMSVVLLFSTYIQAQSLFTMSFLEQPVSAHHAALGGNNTSYLGHDISFLVSNPALLSIQSSNELSVNVASYFAGSGYGSGIYSRLLHERGMLGAGFQYMGYGEFTGFDEYGVETGTFSARDVAFFVSYSQQLNNYFSIGATVKPVLGGYERYVSYALAGDMGIVFMDKENGLQVGFSAKNIGVRFAGYESDESASMLPLNLSLGASKKLLHAPFVFHLTMQQLQRWTYDVSTNVDSTSISFVGELARHFIVGVDVLPPSDKFWLALSYNFLRGQELPVPEIFSLSGFSGGIGFFIKDVELGIGFGSYHQAATTLHISLRTDLTKFGL